MRRSFLLLLGMLIGFLGLSAQKIDQAQKDEIVAEAQRMFRLELASWQATDRLRTYLEFPEYNELAGYLSYPEEREIRTIFYSDTDPVVVLATVTFDENSSPGSLQVDSSRRSPSATELLHIRLREKALANARNDEENFYAVYEKTGMNLVVLPGETEHKVYFMTAPQIEGVILMGNDYLLVYDEDLNLKKREKIHEGLIQMRPQGEEGYRENMVTAHEHSKNEPNYATSTDICTLLLYAQLTDWVAHQILSPKFVSIWDIDSEQLLILTRKAFNKIAKAQEGKQAEK